MERNKKQSYLWPRNIEILARMKKKKKTIKLRAILSY